jgi:hypothetical protein
MNFLDVIRQAQIKRQRVWEAQLLATKAYRGINYQDAHNGPEVVVHKTLTYRGNKYDH